MGDLARNIARRAVFLSTHPQLELPDDLGPMAQEVQTMVRQSLEALVHADVRLARRVCAADDEVDALRTTIQDEVEHQIAMHPERTECLVRLLSVSRHLERLADMATNIAEDVIYMVEGDIVRHKHTV
jgi:phosphate transport system protein